MIPALSSITPSRTLFLKVKAALTHQSFWSSSQNRKTTNKHYSRGLMNCVLEFPHCIRTISVSDQKMQDDMVDSRGHDNNEDIAPHHWAHCEEDIVLHRGCKPNSRQTLQEKSLKTHELTNHRVV